MKVVILSFIICFVAYSRAENRCQCAAFFTKDVRDDRKVRAVPDVYLPNCNGCQQNCIDTLGKETKYGDLSFVISNGMTVGSYACMKYPKDIRAGQLAAYSRCGLGGWVRAKDAKGLLCCRNGKVC